MANSVAGVPTMGVDRRNGNYNVKWYDRSAGYTRRVSLGTKEKIEAEQRFAAFLAQNANPGASVAHGKDVVATVINQYLEEHVRRRAVDAVRQEYCLKNIVAFFGDHNLPRINEEDFEAYLDARVEGDIGRPAGEATVRREIGAFKAAVNHAVSRRRMSSMDAPIWWMPDAPEARCDKWLTKEQLDKLLGCATSPKLERFMLFAYWTAGRRRAITNLQANRLRDGNVVLHPPHWRKTKKRNATVPAMGPLVDLIPQILLFYDGDDFIFDYPGWTGLRRGWEASVAAAGMPHVTPHWLRHSRATHLLQDSKPPWHVSQLLGDTVQMVERVYGHHCTINLKKVLE